MEATQIKCFGGPLDCQTLALNSPESGTLEFTMAGMTGRYAYRQKGLFHSVLEWEPKK